MIERRSPGRGLVLAVLLICAGRLCAEGTTVADFNKNGSEYFLNTTPDIAAFIKDSPFSTTLASLKDGLNLDGYFLFDEEKKFEAGTHKYGIGTYSLDFLLNPTAGYWFGFMIGEKDPGGCWGYSQNSNAILCYAIYNGGGYAFVLSVNGQKQESRKLGQWVWGSKWYRLILAVKSELEVVGSIVEPSSGQALDTLVFTSPAPLSTIPGRLWLITETCNKINFLRLGRVTVTASPPAAK